MSSFFNKSTRQLLQHVKVQGISPPDTSAATTTATAHDERTLEEQTAMLQRQLERLKAQHRLRMTTTGAGEEAAKDGEDGGGGNDDDNEGDEHVSSGENSDDDDQQVALSEPHSTNPTEEDADAEQEESTLVQKGPVLYFQAGAEQADTWCSIYRDVLPSRGEEALTSVVENELRALPEAGPWAIFMLAGGHFAGALVDNGEIKHHKCFHRYVVRAKRGTVQSVRDSKSGTSQPKSAGSNLRRYNEAQLRQDIEDLLRDWKPHLQECKVIFHRTSVHNRSFLFQSAKQQKKAGSKNESDLMLRNDPRVRTIPFPTQRPTLKEIARVYSMLACINLHNEEPAFIRQHREQTERASEMPAQQERHTQPAQSEEQAGKDQAKKGSNPTALDATPHTVLYKAALKGDLAKVRRLLDRESVSYDSVADTVNHVCGRQEETPLHAASRKDFPDIVTLLLQHGADPTLRNAKRQPPYALTKSKSVRDAFRRYRYEAPERFDYTLAQVPSALTPEMEEARKTKQAEARKKTAERRKAKERVREKQALEEERRRAERPQRVKMSSAGKARQLRAQAALKRLKAQNPDAIPENHCSYCLKDLSSVGNEFFSRMDFKYCSMHCLKTHKLALESRN